MRIFNQEISKIYLLDCLSDEDRTKDQLAVRINEYIIQHVESEIKLANADAEVFTRLEEIFNEMDSEPIIIQIFAHGNCDGFGNEIKGANRIDLNWEAVRVRLTEINRKCHNRLIINTMTICFGASISKINANHSLYLGMVGSNDERALEGLEHCLTLYREVIEYNTDVRDSIENLNKNLIRCERDKKMRRRPYTVD